MVFERSAYPEGFPVSATRKEFETFNLARIDTNECLRKHGTMLNEGAVEGILVTTAH